jgi:hypothetical protein
VAIKKIEILCRNINITTINEKLSRQAIQNERVNDFEDGLEYYSALNELCNFIVTENQEDFYFSEIPVVNCEQFLFKHLWSVFREMFVDAWKKANKLINSEL